MSRIVFFLTFFSVYGLLNFYIARRALQAFEMIPFPAKIILGFVFLFFAFGYIISKAAFSGEGNWLYDMLTLAGSYWMAAIVYILLSLLLIDIFRLVNNYAHIVTFTKQNLPMVKFYAGSAVLFMAIVLMVYGRYHASDIKVRSYNITLPKKQSELTHLKVAFFSDSHFTSILNTQLGRKIHGLIAEHKPDLVLLGGDVIDDRVSVLKRHNVDVALQNINAPMGVFTCVGNHEYIADALLAEKYLNENGIAVIRDTVSILEGKLNIIGRDDYSVGSFVPGKRKELKELVTMADPNLPTILLDHQPRNLEQAQNAGIDLQLSGHTHEGQFFPGNLIVKKVYELAVGYLKKGNTQYIVSSGIGTWGPPIRLGTDSEFIVININFE